MQTNTAQELDDLDESMRSANLIPLWQLESEIMGVTPAPKTQAWIWRWDDLYAIAERAGELVPVERGGDRRAIALANPGLGGLPYATATLWAAVQWLNGREVAPAHRHTSQAIRLIIDCAGSYSLERGDLVLTPPWLWHDHGSESEERAVWMDALDIPLTNYADAGFFEPDGAERQEITEQLNGTVLKHGVGQMRPSWEPLSTDYPPMSTYKWADTERALTNLAAVDADPCDDVSLEYINPHTGGPVMRSFGCRMQMLRPGIHTRAHRHTGSTVYLAFEGEGATIIDGVRFDWKQGDMFVLPSWAVHEHLNGSASERALLFSVHDTPLLEALDKYRIEAVADRQRVSGEFGEVG